jgi:hypothetical protein
MRPGALIPKPLRRRRPRTTEDRPLEARVVFERDGGCIAALYDRAHRCEGRLTLGHVPELGKNALGKKPPFDRYHLVGECLGANSGGTRPWSEMNRDIERRHLATHYPEYYRR